ncbi:ABC transporter ATP-binding protein [Williamsia sp.]|uniref:ABC transporter ATP-binding protein n=1 Tax=Williamsia sp. TaxID=1872085 RepID=UPI002F93519E
MKIDHVRKRYSPNAPYIVADLHLEVQEGEFVAIVGPSGAGKSTLLRIMAGLLEPTEGAVYVAGVEVTSPPPEMALVFQDYTRSLMPWLTVERNVGFPLVGRKDLSSSERSGRIAESLEAVGLAGKGKQYPWQLSGGMQQRVAIARALAYRPKILLLDEPFASVDALTREGLEDLLLSVQERYRHEGITMVLVTHDIDEAVYLADRVEVLAGPPTVVRDSVDVPLPRPRNQIATRSSADFLRLRSLIHQHMGVQSTA